MKTNMTSKSEDLALDYEKSEDPAKMTYSISDFSEQDPRILPRLTVESYSPRTKIKT